MNNAEILQKAIEKAEKNGYFNPRIPDSTSGMGCFEIMAFDKKYHWIIFSHNFAKAFFGEEKINPKPTGNLLLSMPPQTEYHYDIIWQYHLQQLVLEEEPLKYLEKFL